MKIKFAKHHFILGTMLAAFCLAGSPMNSLAQDQPATVATDTASSIPADVDPNSPLAQVIRLAQSGVDESVILGYINGSSVPFNLTSDQIIYLKDLGLPDAAATAMMQRDQQLGVAAPAPIQSASAVQATSAPVIAAEPPAAVTQNYFYDTLSPYGNWVNVDNYGLCWQPTVVVYNASWQPYGDHGHWVNTDSGWYWLSDYAWGATAFHYGRWFRDARRGWCWWPDTTWAPSWVTWRNTAANDYCGWAPLPPHTAYRAGVGITFNGAVVAAGFNFGLSANLFTFVPTKDFCDPHPFHYRVPPAQITQIYQRTTIINNFNVNSRDKTIMNVGIAPNRITAVTRKQIPRMTLRDSATPVARGRQINGTTLLVNRPRITAGTVTTLNRGVKPPVVRQNAPARAPQNARNNNFTGQNHPSVPTSKPGNPPQRNSAVQGRRQTPGVAARNAGNTQKPGFSAPYISPRQQDLKRQSRSVPYNRNAKSGGARQKAPQHSPPAANSNSPRPGNSTPNKSSSGANNSNWKR